jgi:hypothetical protein
MMTVETNNGKETTMNANQHRQHVRSVAKYAIEVGRANGNSGLVACGERVLADLAAGKDSNEARRSDAFMACLRTWYGPTA